MADDIKKDNFRMQCDLMYASMFLFYFFLCKSFIMVHYYGLYGNRFTESHFFRSFSLLICCVIRITGNRCIFEIIVF